MYCHHYALLAIDPLPCFIKARITSAGKQMFLMIFTLTWIQSERRDVGESFLTAVHSTNKLTPPLV